MVKAFTELGLEVQRESPSLLLHLVLQALDSVMTILLVKQLPSSPTSLCTSDVIFFETLESLICMQNIISLFVCIKEDLEVYPARCCMVNSNYWSCSCSLFPSCCISILTNFSIMNTPHLQ